jgi:hypothetical protein
VRRFRLGSRRTPGRQRADHTLAGGPSSNTPGFRKCPTRLRFGNSPHAVYRCRGSSTPVTRRPRRPVPSWQLSPRLRRQDLPRVGTRTPRVVLADEKRCMLHAMPTLQQRGLQRPMDLAGRTAETAARSPKFLPADVIPIRESLSTSSRVATANSHITRPA